MGRNIISGTWVTDGGEGALSHFDVTSDSTLEWVPGDSISCPRKVVGAGGRIHW